MLDEGWLSSPGTYNNWACHWLKLCLLPSIDWNGEPWWNSSMHVATCDRERGLTFLDQPAEFTSCSATIKRKSSVSQGYNWLKKTNFVVSEMRKVFRHKKNVDVRALSCKVKLKPCFHLAKTEGMYRNLIFFPPHENSHRFSEGENASKMWNVKMLKWNLPASMIRFCMLCTYQRTW